ncbi:MAG: hypothetical protein Q9220_001516 [cf. Caloplaca sp. 1 TL-2023]
MPPKPTYEFYIPSLHDETTLACRIYSLPELYFGGSEENEATGEKQWTPKGAVVAHPYSTLGGSYDDHVVLAVVEELLNLGFTVGTFNFRGAGKSKGSSTWSGKAELQDYISFVGFFMYYLTNIFPPIPQSEYFDSHYFDDQYALAPVISGTPTARPPAHIIIAGYSYGALLTRYLPVLPVVLARFSRVLKSSTEAQIRLRASALADVTRIDILNSPLEGVRKSARAHRPRQPPIPSSSRDVDHVALAKARSADQKRELMQLLQKPFVRKEKRDTWLDEPLGMPAEEEDFAARVAVPTPKTHYLLISMLVGAAASFLTGFRKLSNANMSLLDKKFTHNQTLMLHGEKDGLMSADKAMTWFCSIEGHNGGAGLHSLIDAAGHFWREPGAMDTLLCDINHWATRCIEGGAADAVEQVEERDWVDWNLN